MKFVYLALAGLLAVIFLRGDVQLYDLVWNANIVWSAAAALFLGGLLIGQWMGGYQASRDSLRWAGWAVVAVVVLAGVEFSLEQKSRTLIRSGDTVVLSAANLEPVTRHVVPAVDGLFRTQVLVNGAKVEALLDTGASLVLLNHATALAAGVDVDKLNFEEPVQTASGQLTVARVMLEEVSVGPIELHAVEAAITPPGREHSNLLGASFLAKLESATFRADRATLQQRR